jgi:hypothetical protein
MLVTNTAIYQRVRDILVAWAEKEIAEITALLKASLAA